MYNPDAFLANKKIFEATKSNAISSHGAITCIVIANSLNLRLFTVYFGSCFNISQVSNRPYYFGHNKIYKLLLIFRDLNLETQISKTCMFFVFKQFDEKANVDENYTGSDLVGVDEEGDHRVKEKEETSTLHVSEDRNELNSTDNIEQGNKVLACKVPGVMRCWENLNKM